jgi:hypothetical protein
MAFWKSAHSFACGCTPYSPRRHLNLLILIAIAAAPGLLLVWLIPPALVLPVVSIASFVIATTIALLAYYLKAERYTQHVTPWDIAGAFALIWIAAGMLSEAEQVFKLFESLVNAL